MKDIVYIKCFRCEQPTIAKEAIAVPITEAVRIVNVGKITMGKSKEYSAMICPQCKSELDQAKN